MRGKFGMRAGEQKNPQSENSADLFLTQLLLQDGGEGCGDLVKAGGVGVDVVLAPAGGRVGEESGAVNEVAAGSLRD